MGRLRPTEFAETVLDYIQEYAAYILQWTQWLNSIVLQIMKNTFVVAMQSQITQWVQGGGNPRFVQSWSQTLTNAFNGAANTVVAQTLPNLSPGFSTAAGVLLQQNATPIQSNIDQELTALGTTQANFSNNFNNGGFAAYFDLFQPDNNLFSALMDTQDAALNAGSNQAQASQARSVAANGFTGDATCSDNPSYYPGGQWTANGMHWTCQDPNTGTDYFANINAAGTLTCDTGQLTQIPNDGLCADGTEPSTQTPGQTTAQGAGTALGSGEELVVNANNTIDLLFAVANNIMQLISTGKSFVTAQPPANFNLSAQGTQVLNQYINQPPNAGQSPNPPANIVIPAVPQFPPGP